MKKNIFTPNFLFITAAILTAAISRILPHPPNFTPIGAMALFGGVYYSNKKFAFIMPLLAMFVSDLVLEFVSGIGFHKTILYVYGSFVLITLIGILIQKNVKTGSVIFASIGSSALFFLVTNFGVWATSGFEMGVSGLFLTYIKGIPFYNNNIFGSFFLNTILGDLFYCGILFGSLAYAKTKIPSLISA